MTAILQFGTSRFLQAHADLFLSEALARGQAIGRVTVVQSSGDPGRAGRLAALAAPGGFPVRIRGLKGGQVVDRETRVTSVARGLSTATDWAEVSRIATHEAQVILSNTSEAGWLPQPADSAPDFDQSMSFPAKLRILLRDRFRAGGVPVQVMPTELVADNGRVLRDRVMALAAGDDPAFRGWLAHGVIWVSSLVDRIVSAPIEPAGAAAEPYALWAIGAVPGLRLPCAHEDVRVFADLGVPVALKLYLLNLAHTVMADDWIAAGGPPGALVREEMADPATRARLVALYDDEILPAFDAAGIGPLARAYAAQTMERFANPFLDHRLSEIAGNHGPKIRNRCLGFLDWAKGHGDDRPRPRLTALAARLKEFPG